MVGGGTNARGDSEERAGERTKKERMMERQWRGGKQMSDTEQCDIVLLMEGAHTCLVPLQ